MRFPVPLAFFLLANFVGFAALFAAVVLWRRESGSSPGWLVSRRGLGMLCVLAAGAGLVVGSQYKLVRWPLEFLLLPEDEGVFSLRLAAFVVACLLLLAVGVVLLVLGRPAGVTRPTYGGPLAWSVAVALIVTLAELSALQNYNSTMIIRGLPRLEIDTKGIELNKTLNKDYQFTDEDFMKHVPIWEKVLQDYKGRPDVHYLEVGLYEGQSALWMLENILTDPTARLTGIDFFPDFLDIETRFYSNLTLSGYEEKTHIIKGFSQLELRKLPVKSFDIIYIDGSHMDDDTLEDCIYSYRLLKDGGIMIIDDYIYIPTIPRERPKLAIDTFLAFFGRHFEIVRVGDQVILKKKKNMGRSSLAPAMFGRSGGEEREVSKKRSQKSAEFEPHPVASRKGGQRKEDNAELFPVWFPNGSGMLARRLLPRNAAG